MKISELVAELEVLWAEHGDVHVIAEAGKYFKDPKPGFDGVDVVL